MYVLKRFKPFYEKKFGVCRSKGCKITSHQTLRMIGPWPGFEPGQTGWLGPGPAGRLFLRPPTLTAGNFAALWPTDPKFLALKDLNPFKTVSKVQKTSSILRVGFALSKWPHLHRAYVVGGCIFNLGTVLHNGLPFDSALWCKEYKQVGWVLERQ